MRNRTKVLRRMVVGVATVVAASTLAPAAPASPRQQLSDYIYAYSTGLRPYLDFPGFTLTAGRRVVVDGKPVVRDAEVRMWTQLPGDVSVADMARHVCAIVRTGVRKLRLRTIGRISVYSVDRTVLVRCLPWGS